MINHTENNTTTRVGQAIATVIKDTESYAGDRITTFELVYPRYIHAELLTHRMFSRNSSSSRATPLKVTLDEVENDPVFFDFVGKNQAGMVAGESLKDDDLLYFEHEWKKLGAYVARKIGELSEICDVHKQTLNRALEPWLRIKTLVTSTDWDNFFALRLAPDAQPEMQSLAKAMKEAMGKSEVKVSEYHFPYVDLENWNSPYTPLKVSVARCARVSYARLDGKPENPQDDVALYHRLLESGHFSPFEHVAFAKKGKYANFKGWQSLRNQLDK